jgi:hypothetical protein
MITTPKQTTLKQSDDFKSYQFGIKESGLSHIFNVLRNQLYSDKVLAVIREYSCNAVDAHTETGKADVPIKVTLPTLMTPEFKVRDFGRGLTEDEIANIYAMYGESTKRGTNEQIGQLGLGCKSAFAYGDNFVINSFVKGTKTTYNAFIDPSDVGQISKMGSEDTKEENGIEIVIPVKSDDFGEFYTKATRLFKHFKVVPNVRGVSGDQLAEDLKQSEVVIQKDNWKLVKGDSFAVMGNIAYPLDSDALNLNWQEDRSDLISAGIVIDFGIGDLEISASREALQYTDKTKNVILTKLESIIKQLPDVLGDKFKECKTLWEVKSLYNEAFAHGGFGQKIKKLVETKGIKWNNINVTSGFFDKQKWKDSDIELKLFRRPDRYSRKKRVKGNDSQKIYVQEKTLVIIDDAPTHHGRLNRIAPLLEQYDNRDETHKDEPVYESVYLVNFHSSKAKKEFLSETHFDFPAKKLTSYDKVVLRDIYPSNSTVSGGTTTTKNSKHSTKVFSLDKTSSYGNAHSCRSDFFESNEVDLDAGGVYVTVSKFFWGKNDNEEKHPHYLVDKVKWLENCGIDVPEIYALKNTVKNVNALEDENSKWVYFEDWAEEAFLKRLESKGVGQKLFDKVYAEHHQHLCERYDEYNEALLEMNNRNDDFLGGLSPSLAKDYINCYNSMLAKEDEELTIFRDTFRRFGKGDDDFNRIRYQKDNKEWEGVNKRGILDGFEPTHDLNAIAKEWMDRYPMINLMDDNHYGWRNNDDATTATLTYVTLVEATYNAKKKIENILEVAEAKLCKEIKPLDKKTENA